MEYGKDDMIAARRMSKKKKSGKISDKRWSDMQKKETDELYSKKEKKAIASKEKQMNKKDSGAINIAAVSRPKKDKPKSIRQSLQVEQPEETGPVVNDIPDPTTQRKVMESRAGADTLGEMTGFMPNLLVGAAPLLMGAIMGDVGEGASVAGSTLLGKESREWEERRKVAAERRASRGVASKPLTRSNVMETIGPDGKPLIRRVEDAVGEQPYKEDTYGQKARLEKLKASLQKKGASGDFTSEQKLRKEHGADPVTEDSKSIAMSYNKIKNIANSPQSGANDISLVFAYMKMLDPGSVVREGEQATARNAGAVPDNIKFMYNRMLAGEDKLLPTTVRGKFVDEAESIYKGQMDLQNQIDSQYSDLAREYGLDPSRVTVMPKVSPRTKVPVRYPKDAEKQQRYERYLLLKSKLGK